MACRVLLFLCILIAAGCQSGAPVSKNQNFQTIAAPQGTFKARKLDGKLILRFEDQAQDPAHVLVSSGSSTPATGAEWARAANISRDEGPEPPFSDPSFPRSPFLVDERSYPTRGSQWLKVLNSTDGAYLAIFSYLANPQPKSRLAFGAVERIGDFFAEIYRRSDGVRVAELTTHAYRRKTGQGGGFIPYMSGPAFQNDLAKEWADAAAWYAKHTLIVPTHEALHIAALLPGTPTPVPDNGFLGKLGLSIASGDAPTLKVLGMREEIFRQGGRIDWVIVHLTVEPEVAGIYSITTQFEDRATRVAEHRLRAGRQELSFGFDKTAFGPGDHRLRWSSITSQLSTRAYNGPPASTTSAPELVTAAYPPNVWNIGRRHEFRLLPDGVVVRRTAAHFEFDVTMRALRSCNVVLSANLDGALGLLGKVHGRGNLYLGSNRVTLYLESFPGRLVGPPHSISSIFMKCDDQVVELPVSVPIPALDFRGIPGAKCAYDYNCDGRVDDGDLPAAMASIDQELAVKARTPGYRPPPIENLRRFEKEMIAKNRTCRTK